MTTFRFEKHHQLIVRASRPLLNKRSGLNTIGPHLLEEIFQTALDLVAANRIEEAREVLAETLEIASRQYVKPYWLAMAHAALDERDAALAWFEKAFAEYDPWIIWFGTDPKLKSLRDDQRFIDLFRRTGNPLASSPR